MRVDRARSRRALLCGVIALACLVSTVFPPSLAAAPAAARTLVFPNSQEPSTLDPHVATDTQSNVIILGIYESLVRFKPDTTEIEPNLAASWTASQNGLNWTFRLRPNVRFHDGSVMNAEAVVFSFNRLKTVAKGMAFVLDNVAEVRAVDAMTVAVRLSRYDVTFFQGLPSVMIVSPAAFGPQMGTDQAQRWAFSNASGTGPFRLATWTRGSRIEITKFDEYWRGWSQPHVDRILMLTVPEPGTRRLMFERGDADMLVKAEDQVDDLKVLQKRPEFTVKSFPTMSSIYLVMAAHRPPLNDVRVRRAISYAFSYKAMIEVAFGGLAAQPRGPLNPSIPFFAPDTFQYQRDIVRARRLLQEAGYGRDKPLEVSFGYVGPSGVQRRTAEILQAYLGEVGIKVVPRPMTFPSLLGLMQKPETVPDIFNLNNHSAYPDPDYTFARFWHSRSSGGGTGLNGGFYKNAEVDRLIDEARGISDAAKRKELYKRVQQLITADAPAIWIANPVTVVVHRPYVKGFQYVSGFSRTLGYLERIHLEGK